MLESIVLALLLIGGAVLSAQSSINGRLGSIVGVLASSWLTFFMGAVITFLLVFFFETPKDQNLFTVPKWQLIGAFFGVCYMVVIVFAAPRIGIAAATVAVISGQLLMSMLIDHFGWFTNQVLVLDQNRYIAIALLAASIYMIYLSNTKRKA